MLQLMIHPHSTKYKGESMCRDNTIYFIFTFDTFLLESRKLFTLLEFFIAVLRDWLKKLVPLCHPIRRKIKTNRDALVHIFPRVTSATRLLGYSASSFDLWTGLRAFFVTLLKALILPLGLSIEHPLMESISSFSKCNISVT